MRKLILLITISLLLPLESAHATLAEGVTNIRNTAFQPVLTGAVEIKSKRGSGAITIEDPEKVESGMEELLRKPEEPAGDSIELILEDLPLQSVKVQNPDQATLAKAVADAIGNMDTTDKQAIAAAELLGANLLKILENHDPDLTVLAKALADAIQNMNPADKQAITDSVFFLLEEESDAVYFSQALKGNGIDQSIITLAALNSGFTNLLGATAAGNTNQASSQSAVKKKSGFKVPSTKLEVNIEEMLESVVRGRVKPILRIPRRKAGAEQIPDVATLTKAVAGAINNMNTTDTKARAATKILGAYLINMLKQKNPDPAELAKAAADTLENIKPADKQAITNVVFSFLKKEKDAIKLGEVLRKKGVGKDIITLAALNSGFTNLFGATTGTAIPSCDITEAFISAASKDAVVDIVAAAFLTASPDQLANIAKCAADAGVSDVDITQAVLLAGIDPTLIQQPTAAGNPNQAPAFTPIAPPTFGSPAFTPIAPPTFGTQTGAGGGEQASSS